MNIKKPITAAILIIGDEILSGKILNTNTQFIASCLTSKGIELIETRTVPDNEKMIIEHINILRNKYDYCFTTGGIGPTHDDITSLSISKAFNVDYVQNEEILNILKELEKTEGKQVNSGRIKMSYIPKGAKLIHNKVTKIPSFYIENVFCFAGIPNICKAMFEEIEPILQNGSVTHSKEIKIMVPESCIAAILTKYYDEYHHEINIGSYPFYGEVWGVNVILRSKNIKLLTVIFDKISKDLHKIENDFKNKKIK